VDIAVIGAGTVGTAIGVLLQRAGHRIVGVTGRDESRGRASSYLPDAPFLDPEEAAAAAELLVIGTPDDIIEQTVDALANAGVIGPGTSVTHLSGSLGLDVLEAAGEAGARILATHPLQTFPDVDSALERLPGCWIAITANEEEGSLLGERLAADLGGVPFRLADELRPLYHAAAVFASNYVVTASAVAETLFELAGVPEPAKAMAPLQRASLEHVERFGPALALTGPAIRGDAGTIRRNLEALDRHAPELVPPYVAMARATFDLADRFGRLPAGSRAAVEDALATWS
jgi:predicted short-subunit dehydrogenase-like oxidoreductase (DUF2520 family)